MDMTRLYNLTTPELRHEAERLGVVDTEALSRAQLINAIRYRVGAAPPDGLLGKVLGLAKWALQTTAPESPPHKTRTTEEHFPRPSERPEVAPRHEPGTRSGAPAGVFSMPTGAASRHEEPFPTRTMARILASQGHYKRALAIYSVLLRNQPGDEELQTEAADVRSRSRARRPTLR